MSSTEGEGEVQVTTTEGILKAAGNDELKFGLLIGLIKVKQVTNKDVVNTVLHLLIGEEFDIESNFIIKEPQNILHTLRLLTNCPITLQAEIWSVFTAILKKSRRNLQACTEVGLIEHALNLLKDTEDVIADLMVEMLGVLATYSITVRELKMLFSLLKATDGKWPQHSVKLLSVLNLMPRRDGPDEFFSFPGKIGSHISLPPIKTWPYQNGWTFSCWLRLDPVTGVTVERERPYLYCFRTNKGVGYSANFLGNSLVLTAMKVKGKGFQHCVKHEFQPRKWYMVTLVYVYNRWSKSELRCYVDGKLVSHTEMSWLVNTSDPFDKCFLGASSEVEADHMFCGQMSSVYLFSESLSPQQIGAIYQLGPNYKGQFRFENESGLTGTNINKKLVYDSKLTNSIMFMYNPMACDSQLCLESSPKGNPSFFVHVQHALMSQDVKAVITQSIHSTLHSLGGVQVFFPLFGQLDFPVDKGEKSAVDHTICANLMSILLNLLESSVTIQQQMLQNKGFLVIGYLLEKASRMHVTPAVLETFLALTQYLVDLPTGSMLLKHLFDHILFNPALWIHASVEVQTKLYCYLATDFISNAQIYNNIRRVSAVLQTMHTLKFYYWVVNPKDRSGITPKGIDGPRPTYDEIIKLRSFMLLYIKQLLLKGQGVQEDELQSILNYLSTLHEDDNLMDVLQLTVSLMAEHPASMVPSFDKKNGIRTVFKLLASNSEPLQIQALKLLGFFLMRATHKRKADCMGPHNLFSLIGERLMLNEQSITLPVYNVLFELLTERLSGDSVMEKHVEPESYFRIENSAILKVVATMIRQSKPTAEVAEVKKTFLSDLTIMCNNNRENRRTVLQMSVWQDWLFSLSYIYSRNDEEKKVTDMVMALFRMLLHHAIKYEYGGWRVWIDTLAILHSKVAYEDFKIHMSKMYRQYDQQRVDDVDPQERQNYPISTISGISDNTLQDQQESIKSSVQIKEVENSTSDETKPEPKTIQNGEVDDQKENEEKKEEKSEADGKASEDTKDDGKESGDSKDDGKASEDTQDDGKESDKKEAAEASVAAGDKSDETQEEKKSEIPREITNTGVKRNPSRAQSFRGSMESHGNRHVFSPGPRAPPFRIPEFRWSGLHQKLLSDLLFSVETDLQVWKSHSTKTVIDFVNSGDNHVYVVNVTHMISQLADNLITSCGGLLALLAAATSPNGEMEILEPTQGLSIEQAVSILQRIMNMMDVLVFASSTNFAELEQEKNMPSGGILRQCLRLVCTSSVRNCLECRHRNRPHSPPGSPTSSSSRSSRNMNGVDPIQSLIMASHPTERNIVENLNEQTSPIKDYEKLLQDMDINRLRAVVYRDVEETKQAQFLALAIVYFTSVLMVSKYRDILEPPTPAATPTINSHRQSINSPSDDELESGEDMGTSEGDLTQEITEEEDQEDEEPQREPQQNNVDKEPRERVKIKADIHITDSTDDEDSESVDQSSTDLNRTADSADVAEEVDEKEDEETDDKKVKEGDDETEDKEEKKEEQEEKKEEQEEKKGEQEEKKEEQEEEKSEEEAADEQKVEDKPEDEQEKQEADGGSDPESAPQGSEAPQGEQEEDKGERPESEGQEAEEVQKNIPDAEKERVAVSQREEDTESKPDSLPISAITVDVHSNREQKPQLEKLDLGAANMPMPVDNLPSLSGEGGSLTERLERALGPVAPLLREIFVDFAPFLSKTLIGSHGQELLIGGLVTLKQSTSVVELVMLLCSQEWQNSLQKHAGLAFIELVNEGRLLAHATRDHIVRVANEAEFILNRMRAEDVQKHAEFESLGAQTMLDRKEEEKLCDHLIKSAKRRDHVAAVKLRDKILNILSNKHGAWGSSSKKKNEYWKLDVWEDDSRRRRRLVKNPNGSSHPDATLKAAIEHGATEDAINQAREAFHAHLASTKRAQQTPDYTDEELLMEERDFEQDYAGPVALSTACKLIAPGVMVNGTMAITKTELYFEMDEDNEENKKMDPQVLSYVEHLHGRWHFNEVRAIFSRRYLLQNVAIEIFMANRTAVMFAFPDHATVKKVINALPRVGVGVKYGLPQARRMSLASGKQLFKLSCMTQKWQRREISNFDYLMYLNTIAGRTYNDLNQYSVFPWVIVNYESEELDLSQPNNFRDLSKPIGALNPTRKEFFDERYETWEHDQIPPFHYGTHFSTAAFTLNWLIRVEPFTSIFLNMQGGKFDHANRTFFSIAQAWKNCQRDTSDVKELVPEHFFLPEMLVNENDYNLGQQDDGLEVKDVILPPWAKSPEDFIRTNRMALESEFVSCQLHHWIDLIFGYKQRGPEAVRSTNVFYYLTYEGSVDLESMTDPVMKEAIENQIRSFGQTPTQLLTEPHPPRSSVMHLTPMMFSTVQDDVCMIMKFLSNSPVTYVAANTHPAVPVPAVTTISCSHNFAINKWNPSYQQQGTPTSFSSEKPDTQANLPLSMDQLLALNTGLQRRTLGDNFDERMKARHSSFTTSADNRFIFACGFWDKSFRLFSTETAKILQVVHGHFDVVTCLTRSECNLNQDCYIITGSKDCTVMVWMFTARNMAIIGDNGSLEHPTPKATLTGHESEVTCVAVLAELGLVMSGSQNGPCLVHTLSGDLLRSLEAPEGCRTPQLITMSRESFVLVKFDEGHICNFSINGRLLLTVRHKDNIQSMILSRDGQYMMLGGSNGVVEVWRSHDLTLLYAYPPCDSEIRSLALTHDHKFLLAGLGTGCLLVFNIDFNKWHHEYQERY